MIENCALGVGVVVYHDQLVNLYGCTVGSKTTIGPFVEIQRGAVVGAECKICSHAFICAGATLGDRVFVGHGVMFCNDLYPVIGEYPCYELIRVDNDVSIGSGAVILPVHIGQGAIIGAGAVVVAHVAPYTVMAGNPARVIRHLNSAEERRAYLNEQQRYHLRSVP